NVLLAQGDEPSLSTLDVEQIPCHTHSRTRMARKYCSSSWNVKERTAFSPRLLLCNPARPRMVAGGHRGGNVPHLADRTGTMRTGSVISLTLRRIRLNCFVVVLTTPVSGRHPSITATFRRRPWSAPPSRRLCPGTPSGTHPRRPRRPRHPKV